jgi:hypothetical protein
LPTTCLPRQSRSARRSRRARRWAGLSGAECSVCRRSDRPRDREEKRGPPEYLQRPCSHRCRTATFVRLLGCVCVTGVCARNAAVLGGLNLRVSGNGQDQHSDVATSHCWITSSGRRAAGLRPGNSPCGHRSERRAETHGIRSQSVTSPETTPSLRVTARKPNGIGVPTVMVEAPIGQASRWSLARDQRRSQSS